MTGRLRLRSQGPQGARLYKKDGVPNDLSYNTLRDAPLGEVL